MEDKYSVEYELDSGKIVYLNPTPENKYCPECSTMLLEQNADHNAGSTPTSPMVLVKYRCPICGHGLRTTVRRP